MIRTRRVHVSCDTSVCVCAKKNVTFARVHSLHFILLLEVYFMLLPMSSVLVAADVPRVVYR